MQSNSVLAADIVIYSSPTSNTPWADATTAVPRKGRHKNAMFRHERDFPKALQRKMAEEEVEAAEVVGAMADEITMMMVAEVEAQVVAEEE